MYDLFIKQLNHPIIKYVYDYYPLAEYRDACKDLAHFMYMMNGTSYVAIVSNGEIKKKLTITGHKNN